MKNMIVSFILFASFIAPFIVRRSPCADTQRNLIQKLDKLVTILNSKVCIINQLGVAKTASNFTSSKKYPELQNSKKQTTLLEFLEGG